MALHMLRSAPSFTISLRGYDKEEVDEYVDSLRDGHDVDAEALDEASAAITRLEEENSRLSERANDLESCLRVETPRSIFALGQRLTLILEQAEDAAGETVAQANEEAEQMVAEASASADGTLRHAAQQAAEAEERAVTMTREAEERAVTMTREAETRAAAITLVADEAGRRTEDEARRSAETLLAGAEARAQARSDEMEAWAERMHAHLCQERDRAAEEFARVWEQRQADLQELADRRAELLAGLEEMRSTLSETVEAARAATVAALAGRAELSEVDAGPVDVGTVDVGTTARPYDAMGVVPALVAGPGPIDPGADDPTGQLDSLVVLRSPVVDPEAGAVTIDDGEDDLDGWAASWRMTDTGA